jgi:hypothetical protein
MRARGMTEDVGFGPAVIVCEGEEWEVSTPAGIRKPDIFVIPREIARAVMVDETSKVIPGSGLLLVAEVSFDPASLLNF